MAVSTFRPVGEVDINSRAKIRDPATTQGLTMADSNKCDVEIKAPEKTKVPENQNNLVQSINNRKQECQKINNKFSTASQFRELLSLSLGCEWKIGKESSILAVQELYQNEHMILSSVTDI